MARLRARWQCQPREFDPSGKPGGKTSIAGRAIGLLPLHQNPLFSSFFYEVEN